jgi:hypothetical protein
MAKITFNIQVDDNGNVDVTQSPRRRLKLNKDTVTFKSNRDDTAIKFTTSSPFSEVRTGRVLRDLKVARGSFKVIKKPNGKTHVDCGHIVGRSFRRWSETGFDIPPPC